MGADREGHAELVVEAKMLGERRPVRVRRTAPVLPVGADRRLAYWLEEMQRAKWLPAGEDDAPSSNLVNGKRDAEARDACSGREERKGTGRAPLVCQHSLLRTWRARASRISASSASCDGRLGGAIIVVLL
jgi:hypothetical protein